jgi:hypothetical protein
VRGRRRRCEARRGVRWADLGVAVGLVLEVGDRRVLCGEQNSKRCNLRRIGRLENLLVKRRLVVLGIRDLRAKARELDLGRVRLHRLLVEGVAPHPDAGGERQSDDGGGDFPPILTSIVGERVEVPFVLLLDGELGKTSLRSGLGSNALRGRVLEGDDFGGTSLLVELDAAPLFFDRSSPMRRLLDGEPGGLEPRPFGHLGAANRLTSLFLDVPLVLSEEILDRCNRRGFHAMSPVLGGRSRRSSNVVS